MAEAKETKKQTQKETKPKLVEMKHRETGKSAMVHPDMVAEYKKGEFVEVH